MKTKQVKAEIKKVLNTPEINKETRHYQKGNDSSFIEKLKIYKFAYFAKRNELTEKLKIKENAELNENPRLIRKRPLSEIQKNISEKLIAEKIKKLEREMKARLLKREFEISKLSECTFKPEISKNSRYMGVSAKGENMI